MGKIIPLVREMARLRFIDATGSVQVVDVDITGPTVEQAKALNWAAQLIVRDGGKILSVQFGTKQAGEFREEQRDKMPLFQRGYRRMSAFLRA